MQINPYLVFNGTCEEAFRFYAQALRGELAMLQRFGESPGCKNFPEAHRNKIMHARLQVGDQVLMASDNHPEHPYDGIKGVSIAINVERPEEADRVFNALGEGGAVLMPLQETFWAQRFGMLNDRYGVSWMINCAAPPPQ